MTVVELYELRHAKLFVAPCHLWVYNTLYVIYLFYLFDVFVVAFLFLFFRSVDKLMDNFIRPIYLVNKWPEQWSKKKEKKERISPTVKS